MCQNKTKKLNKGVSCVKDNQDATAIGTVAFIYRDVTISALLLPSTRVPFPSKHKQDMTLHNIKI